ncbi:VOC family protein [bacterium]|nr:VOC family protein [bacterium]
MKLEIDHIAIAVENLESAVDRWLTLTGAILVRREYVAAQDTEVAFLSLGGSRIELIAPASQGSVVSRFLEKRGPGLHHLALKASDGQEVLNCMADRGARLIDEQLRPGAEESLVGFVHPTAFGGVLVEIVEHPNHS